MPQQIPQVAIAIQAGVIAVNFEVRWFCKMAQIGISGFGTYLLILISIDANSNYKTM